MRIPWIPIVVVLGIVAVVAVIAYLIIQSGQSKADRFAHAATLECKLGADGACTDPDPGLPGQWVNLPKAWADGSTLAHYGVSGAPNTNSHVTHDVDYSKETSANSTTGLPPVGGDHWGASACPDKVADAPAYCGPVPWGIYREPNVWPASSLVHNMEHSGVVIWYNTSDTKVRDQIEKVATSELKSGKLVVMTPYPDIAKDTIALTAWSRRDVLPVSELTDKRVKDFIEKLGCRFNPEKVPCG
jgi:hypothetical protein